MALKAVFLEFNGIIINDADLQQRLVADLLLSENLRPDGAAFTQTCLGRSDRACLRQLLLQRGRVVTEDYLDKLLTRKSDAYRQNLAAAARSPIYAGLTDFLYQLKAAQLPVSIVTGARRVDVDWVLEQAALKDTFTCVVTGEDLSPEGDKPSPEGFQVAIARLNTQFPSLTPQDCLAVESSFVGITAAKQAGVPVAGVAHCYPYRMMEQRANWAVDYLNDLDLEWIQRRYEQSGRREGEVSVTPPASF